MEYRSSSDLLFGIELNGLNQEQVVSRFRELAAGDIEAAATQYEEFAARLEAASHGGNAQVRAMVGGPVSEHRAQLVDILASNYSEASDETKVKFLELALEPMRGDNLVYVRIAVMYMTNPHLIGDIIRRYPLYFPGFNSLESDLIKADALGGPGAMQSWLDRHDGNYFAATTLAMQTDYPADVAIVIDANRELFEGAAHIVAARHDAVAEGRLQEPNEARTKKEILLRSRAKYVQGFTEIIRAQADRADWIAIK